MRDVKNTRARRAQASNHFEEPFDLIVGECSGRFVHHENPSRSREHLGDLHELLLCDGQRAGRHVGRYPNAKLRECRFGGCASDAAIDKTAACGLVAERNEPTRGGFIDRSIARTTAEAAFAQLGVRVPPDVPAGTLSVAQQQLVEIAKVLARSARVLVMDEPTAPLSDYEIERLFEVVRRLRAAGAGIFYISHRMEELNRIADRVTVLRDGKAIETRPASGFPIDEILHAMVGRKLEALFPELPPAPPAGAPVRLDVRSLRRAPNFDDITFSVKAGEIVGMAG